MQEKRFVAIMAALTVVFSALMAAYNFWGAPSVTPSVAAASGSGVDFNTLFEQSSAAQANVSTSAASTQVQQAAAPAPSSSAAPKTSSRTGTGSKTQSAPAGPVNINTASAAELDTLPGIGGVLSQRIIDYRSQNGRYQNVDELLNVKGIGDKLLAKIKPYVKAG